MGGWLKSCASLALVGTLVLGLSTSAQAAGTEIDKFEAKIKLSFDSGLDDSPVSETVSTNKLKPEIPLTGAVLKNKGASTSAACLKAGFLYDGGYLLGGFYPAPLLAQYKPINNKPAVLTIDFKQFDLSTNDDKPLRGFSFKDFWICGTVPRGGYAKISFDLELDAEGPSINIDNVVAKVSKTYDSDFAVCIKDLVGPNGIFGVDLSGQKLDELELTGAIQFEVLGTPSAATVLEVK